MNFLIFTKFEDETSSVVFDYAEKFSNGSSYFDNGVLKFLLKKFVCIGYK